VLGLLLVGPAGLDSSHPGTFGRPNALSYSNDNCWGGVRTSKLRVFAPVPDCTSEKK